MILFRYISSQLLQAFFVIFVVLAIIVLGDFLCVFLAHAASGSFLARLVLNVLNWMGPNIFMIITPISLFAALLVTFGKLFANQELWVMLACGITWKKLFMFALPITLTLTVFSAVFNFYLTPLSLQKLSALKSQATQKSVLLANAKTFYAIPQLGTVYFSQKREASNGSEILTNFHLIQHQAHHTTITYSPQASVTEDQKQIELALSRGWQERLAHNGQKRTIHFQRYTHILLPTPTKGMSDLTQQEILMATPTRQLLHSAHPNAQIELRWRLTLTLMPFIATLIALVLSKVPPRKSKYHNLLPASLAFIFFYNLLSIVHNLLLNQALPTWLGFWWLNLASILTCLAIIRHKDHGTLFPKKIKATP